MKKYNIGVIGVGTAGIISLSHCLNYLGIDWTVTSIYNPNKPILGIGESTSTQIPENLFGSIGFNLLEDNDLDATIKLGVKFTGWRDYDFFSHMMVPNYGIHFNNFKLKDFAFKKFYEIYPSRFKELHGDVTGLQTIGDKAEVAVNGEIKQFDYIIDCGGWPADYEDYDIAQSIAVNNCLVNMVPQPGDWNYTYHTATPDGWMFGIPLKTRQGWGYLYNDNITDKDSAIENMSKYFTEQSFDEKNLKEFKFKSYKAKKFIDGRVIKNGNKALFYEPIEALSGYFYDQVLRFFFDYLLGKYNLEEVNNYISQKANDIELGIAYIYQGGSTYNTEFWKHAVKISKNKLDTDPQWKKSFDDISVLKGVYPRGDRLQGVGLFSLRSWLDFDKNLGYNQFT